MLDRPNGLKIATSWLKIGAERLEDRLKVRGESGEVFLFTLTGGGVELCYG